MADYISALVKVYERALNKVLDSVVEKKCHGCRYDKPSQRDHVVCLKMRLKERVTFCLEGCLESICEDSVMRKFGRKLSDADILRCPLKYYIRSWRADLWKLPEWKKAVIGYVVQLRTNDVSLAS